MKDTQHKLNSAINIMKTLRGFFGTDSIYLGGSLALNHLLGGDRIPVGDIDIFICSPRAHETWALVSFLESFGYDVFEGEGKPQYYLIPQQTKLLKVKRGNTNIDIILVDSTIYDLAVNGVYSNLSSVFYELAYTEVSPIKTPTAINIIIKDLLADVLLYNRYRILNRHLATQAHLEKIEKRAKILGITDVIGQT